MSIEGVQVTIPTTLSGTISLGEEIISKLPANPTIKDIVPHLTTEEVNEYLFQLNEYVNELSKDKEQLLNDWQSNKHDCQKNIEVEVEE